MRIVSMEVMKVQLYIAMHRNSMWCRQVSNLARL